MTDQPIPDADEADAQEQAEEVGPGETAPSEDANPPEIPEGVEVPLDASEADVIEQSLEVPLDEDEDYR